MVHSKELYEQLSKSVDYLDYSSYTLQYPPPFLGEDEFNQTSFSQELETANLEGCGLYIHIPFCETKCTFCRYYSIISFDDALRKEYVECLTRELNLYLSCIKKDLRISSLYIGGGTPSMLSASELDLLLSQIFGKIKITDNFQFCIEVNPSSVTYEKMKVIAQYHCNRFTIGVQSLDENVLKIVNRLQKKEDVIQTISWARELSIPNINIDLMAGIRGQSLKCFLKDLQFILSMKPDMIHIHPYTSTERVIDSRIFTENERLNINMVKIGNSILQKNGYTEIDGDANGKTIYARNKQLYDAQMGGYYIGLGVSAVGYIGRYRYINDSDIHRYMQKIKEGIFPINFGSKVSKRASIIQYIIYNMRYGKIDRESFHEKFGIDMILEFKDILESLKDIGVVTIDEFFVYFHCKTPKDYSIYSKYFYESHILESYLNRK